jgi:F-type H+-transporting ATPase subunit epsilon
MAENKLKLRIIAPEKASDKDAFTVDREADMVIMRCETGDMGILPGRAPVSAVLGNGHLRLFVDEKEEQISINGGMAFVLDDVVTIMTKG